MIEFLVKQKGIQIDQEDEEKATPLLYAVSKKSLEMVKFLEAHGANLNHREMLLRTPLYFAASQGSNHIIKYLIERGCDVNVPSNLGRTALGKACWNGEPEVVQLLLDHQSIDIDYLDTNRRTALHNCVWG